MEPVAEIPGPQPGDSETVVSLLETAQAFSAKGDAAQALSWLKRAAASAGEDGNDLRTLALARSVSSLGDRLRAPGALLGAAAPLGAQSKTPKPPLRSSEASEAPDVSEDDLEEDETPLLLATRADKSATSVRPPPPSSRTASPSLTPAPRPSAPTNGAASTETRTRPPPKPAAASPPSVAPGATRNTPVVPSAPAVAKPREAWRMRDAARVSIVKSPTEPGLYYVRVLEEGKRSFEGFEGLLVALDPESTLRP